MPDEQDFPVMILGKFKKIEHECPVCGSDVVKFNIETLNDARCDLCGHYGRETKFRVEER